ncbi:hypothetical protein QFC19_003947 [Naganishia cerealis]|uniref:Uncharacterized protein n=1 Tax=Naganishia cerealis TaxID=610337 RepID=A0ACC2W185_9TREE|nr:hypothetical protein QFC19_003947 [Naganishia cerealis]
MKQDFGGVQLQLTSTSKPRTAQSVDAEMDTFSFSPNSRKKKAFVLPYTIAHENTGESAWVAVKGYVRELAAFRHPLLRKRSSTVIALCVIALCGGLTLALGSLKYWKLSEEPLGRVAILDAPHSDRRVEIIVSPSPVRALLDGMQPLEDNDEYPRVRSKLGLDAERSYTCGPRNLDAYRVSLAAFIDAAMPANLRSSLHLALLRHTNITDRKLYLKEERDRLPGVGEVSGTKTIWQTNISSDNADSHLSASWENNGEGWDWKLLNHATASRYVRDHLAARRLKDAWNLLPSGVLRADMLRYLVLLLDGGIFSDADTKRIKPISEWGSEERLWQKGTGWLQHTDGRLQEDEMTKGFERDELGPPSVIVGIAVDAGEYENWRDFAPRPVQIASWTMSSTPHHPIFLDAIRYIMHHAVESTEASLRRVHVVQSLLENGEKEMAQRVGQEAQEGVAIWKGASSFTDAVMR